MRRDQHSLTGPDKTVDQISSSCEANTNLDTNRPPRPCATPRANRRATWMGPAGQMLLLHLAHSIELPLNALSIGRHPAFNRIQSLWLASTTRHTKRNALINHESSATKQAAAVSDGLQGKPRCNNAIHRIHREHCHRGNYILFLRLYMGLQTRQSKTK